MVVARVEKGAGLWIVCHQSVLQPRRDIVTHLLDRFSVEKNVARLPRIVLRLHRKDGVLDCNLVCRREK